MIPRRALIWKLTKGFILLVGLWGVLAILAAYETYTTRNEAGDFLADLMQLQVGKSSFDQVAPLIAIYHGEWRRYPPVPPGEMDVTPCGSGARIVEFVFENRWIHWGLFAPQTTFFADIDLKDNCVCFRSMGLITTAGGFHGVQVQEFREGRISRSFEVGLNLYRTLITMTAAATTAQRTAAYSVNLDCLTRLRGCRDTREMAPTVWQNSREVGPNMWRSQWAPERW